MSPAAATTPGAGEALLDPEFLGRIRRLEVVARRRAAGRSKGERRSRRRGTSVEFADHRDYAFGDEPRFIDWNSYARLEKLYLKLFMEEEDLSVRFLIDTSRSMGFGAPVTKLLHAKRIAAALAYVALVGNDRVSIGVMGGDTAGPALPPKRGRVAARQVFDHLAAMTATGQTDLEAAARRQVLTMRGAGLCVVIGDFMDKAGYEPALRRLMQRRHEIFVVQTVSPEELRPTLTGDLRLIDSEDGGASEVTVTERLLRRYAETADAWCDGLRQFCAARGIGYLRAVTDQPFEDTVLKSLKAGGLVR